MIGLCLALAAAAGEPALRIEADAFTLAWTHTVERTEWRETYRVEPVGLVLAEAAIRGSGAGMEPPAEATLVEGWWVYRPALPPLPRLRLARSGIAGDYRLCAGGSCRPLGGWLPPAAGGSPVDLFACAASAGD